MWDDESRYAPDSDHSESHVDRAAADPPHGQQRWSGRATPPRPAPGTARPPHAPVPGWDPSTGGYGQARRPEQGTYHSGAAPHPDWPANQDERETWDPRYDGPAAGRAVAGDPAGARHSSDPSGQRWPTRDGWSGAQHAAPEQPLPPWRPVGAANVASSTAAAARPADTRDPAPGGWPADTRGTAPGGWPADTRGTAADGWPADTRGTAAQPQRGTGTAAGLDFGRIGDRPPAGDGPYRDAAPAADAGQDGDEHAAKPRTDSSPYNWLLYLPVLVPLCTPLYNRIEPTMFGMPFFYWAQLGFTFLSAAVIAGVHLATTKEQ